MTNGHLGKGYFALLGRNYSVAYDICIFLQVTIPSSVLIDCAILDLMGSIMAPILKYISMKQPSESASVDSTNKRINIKFPITNAFWTEHTCRFFYIFQMLVS